MEFDKSQILSMIGDDSLAQQAEQQLPDVVDHEAHGDMLKQFGIDPGQLVGQQFGAGGAGGGGDGGGGGSGDRGGDDSGGGGSGDSGGDEDS